MQITDLPREIIEHIIRFIDLKSRCSFYGSCKYFFSFVIKTDINVVSTTTHTYTEKFINNDLLNKINTIACDALLIKSTLIRTNVPLEIRPMDTLKYLSLDIYNCVIDDFVAFSRNLTYLKIKKPENLRNHLNPLLEHLNVCSENRVDDTFFNDLLQCTSLKTLKVKKYVALEEKSIFCLHKLPLLTSLYFDSIVCCDNSMSYIFSLTNLTRLTLINSDSHSVTDENHHSQWSFIVNCSKVHKMTNLTHLKLRIPCELRTITESFTTLTKLETLIIENEMYIWENNNHFEIDINLPRLITLFVRDPISEIRFSGLQNSIHLEHLYTSYNIRHHHWSINSIELENLTKLRLIRTSLSNYTFCSNVRSIYFNNVTDIEPLLQLPLIEHISIYSMPVPFDDQFVNQIKAHKRLRAFGVEFIISERYIYDFSTNNKVILMPLSEQISYIPVTHNYNRKLQWVNPDLNKDSLVYVILNSNDPIDSFIDAYGYFVKESYHTYTNIYNIPDDKKLTFNVWSKCITNCVGREIDETTLILSEKTKNVPNKIILVFTSAYCSGKTIISMNSDSNIKTIVMSDNELTELMNSVDDCHGLLIDNGFELINYKYNKHVETTAVGWNNITNYFSYSCSLKSSIWKCGLAVITLQYNYFNLSNCPKLTKFIEATSMIPLV